MPCLFVEKLKSFKARPLTWQQHTAQQQHDEGRAVTPQRLLKLTLSFNNLLMQSFKLRSFLIKYNVSSTRTSSSREMHFFIVLLLHPEMPPFHLLRHHHGVPIPFHLLRHHHGVPAPPQIKCTAWKILSKVLSKKESVLQSLNFFTFNFKVKAKISRSSFKK